MMVSSRADLSGTAGGRQRLKDSSSLSLRRNDRNNNRINHLKPEFGALAPRVKRLTIAFSRPYLWQGNARGRET